MRTVNPPPGIFGHNRTMVTPHYAVMPPEGILESRLPGFHDTLVRFQTSPSMGARFAQALLEIGGDGGTTRPIEDGLEHFLYVLSGTLGVAAGGRSESLCAGGYGYAPAGAALSLRAGPAGARAIWIKRPYQPAAGYPTPPVLFGDSAGVERRLKHTDGRAWRHLLPDDDLGFDMPVPARARLARMLDRRFHLDGILRAAAILLHRMGGSRLPVVQGHQPRRAFQVKKSFASFVRERRFFFPEKEAKGF
jgi:hypothetical protein